MRFKTILIAPAMFYLPLLVWRPPAPGSIRASWMAIGLWAGGGAVVCSATAIRMKTSRR